MIPTSLMRRQRALLALVLALAPLGRAAGADDDAAALKELRARIERQATELDALRAELTRLEARNGQQPPPAPAKAPVMKDVPLTAVSSPIVFAGLLQGWFTADNGALENTFRIRRVELRFTRTVTRGVGWTVMLDPAKSLSLSSGTVNQASRILQDAYLMLPVGRGVTLTAGQYKLPLALEGLALPMTIDTVERALFASDRARAGTYGDVRDIGIGVRGTLHDRYDYHFSLFNGLGETQNDLERNDRKAVVARFVARLSGGLQLGASGGMEGDARHRIGGELLFTRGPLKLKGEVIEGRDSTVHRRGGYFQVLVQLTPRFDAVGRFDTWDPNTSSDSDPATALERDFIAGFTLRPRDSLRLQVNAVRKTFRGGIDARSLLLINLETVW